MMRSTRIAQVLLSALALLAAMAVGSPGTAATPSTGAVTDRPIMGWSGWDSQRCDPGPTAANIENQAQLLHEHFQRHGYRYVNIDACWSKGVDAYGRAEPDPARFPNGMKPVGDYIRGLGLKFGLYLLPGVPIDAYDANSAIKGTSYHVRDIVAAGKPFATTFKASYKIDFTKPGAQQYMDSWADLLASWGVSYLKVDSVSPGSDDNSYDTRPDIQALSTALHAHSIYLLVSWHIDADYADFYRTYTDAWRTDDDIDCYDTGTCTGYTAWANPTGYIPDTILSRFFDSVPWAPFSGGGRNSDLDSLDVGNGGIDGLTFTERQSAMTLWSIVGSNLTIGDDLSAIDSDGSSLLTNDEVLAVDQSGRAGSPVTPPGAQQVWRAEQPDGSYAVALFNLDDVNAPVTARWQDLGFCGTAGVRDLWQHTSLGTETGGITATLAPHASRLLRVTPRHMTTCPPDAPAPEQTYYEAEAPANVLSGGATINDCSGCSGAKKVGNLAGGGTVRFPDVEAPKAGAYELTLHYATDDPRAGYLSVNGAPQRLIGFFPRTGGWDTVGEYTTRIQLRAGQNAISYGTRGGVYSPDLDRISVAVAPGM